MAGALQLPNSGLPNPRIFHAALLQGLDHLHFRAAGVSVSQLMHGRAPGATQMLAEMLRAQVAECRKSLPARTLCQGVCEALGPWPVLHAPCSPAFCARTCLLSSLSSLNYTASLVVALVLASSSSRSAHSFCGLLAFSLLPLKPLHFPHCPPSNSFLSL